MGSRAVFLDRDGTLNEEVGYLGDVKCFRILPRTAPAVRVLKQAGFLVFVVSNQSGVGRGLFPPEVLSQIDARIEEVLAAEGVKVDAIRYCVHRPDENCDCRKPRLGLFRQLAREFDVELDNSYMVGDSQGDIEAGRRAGCRTVLVLTGAGRETLAAEDKGTRPDHVAEDLGEAANWIVTVAGRPDK